VVDAGGVVAAGVTPADVIGSGTDADTTAVGAGVETTWWW